MAGRVVSALVTWVLVDYVYALTGVDTRLVELSKHIWWATASIRYYLSGP
jgi:hypothetical protein